MAWKGRQLTGYAKNGTMSTFSYDADGLRATKTVGGVKTVYQYVGDQLFYEKRGNSQEFYYFYDSYGNLATIYYGYNNGTTTSRAIYHTLTNAQGDVIAIYNNTGALVARYEYDAWGNIFSVKDASGNPITQQNHIANANPIRYRGYYYDADLGLYYLQSRYYDSETGRFINADGYVTTGQGVLSYNMFAYCLNNPVNMSDPSGHIPFFSILIGLVVGIALIKSGVMGVSYSNTTTADSSDSEESLIETVLPFSLDIGTRSADRNYIVDNSTKPINVYVDGETTDLIFSSSVGVDFNIGKFTLNGNIAFDNIGLYGSVKKEDHISGFGIRGDLTKMKIGFEYYETSISKYGTETTTYTNFSVNMILLVYAYAYASGNSFGNSGQPIPKKATP